MGASRGRQTKDLPTPAHNRPGGKLQVPLSGTERKVKHETQDDAARAERALRGHADDPVDSLGGRWTIDAATLPTFSSSSEGATKLVPASGFAVECSGASGSGKYTSSTTGNIELTFTGCGTPSSASNNCTNTATAGKITTTEFVFHNVVLEPTPSPVLGTLITSNAGHFATFTCTIFGIPNKVVVSGNGIIGQVTSPACGTTEVTESKLAFEQTGGSQKWKQVTTTGTSYDLTSSTNGGAAVTAGQEGKGKVTYNQKVKITCP